MAALVLESNNLNLDETFELLKKKYPDLKIKKVNKTTIFVPKGKISAIIRFKKKKTSVHGDINARDPLNLILIILGIILGLIGVFIIFIILWIIYSRRINSFKTEVFEFLSE